MAAYSKILTLAELSQALNDSYDLLESIPNTHLRKLIRMGEYYIETERRQMEIQVGSMDDDTLQRVAYRKGAIDAVAAIISPMKAILEGEFVRSADLFTKGQEESEPYDATERNHAARDTFFDE